MIVWLNGAFDAETSTAKELAAGRPGSRIFETEHVGVPLRQVMPFPARSTSPKRAEAAGHAPARRYGVAG